jgi:hypothetical protein
MATLATLYDLLAGRSAEQADAQARRMAEERTSGNRLRPFPNDDVHFFVKKIDNSRVIRAADPDEPKVCWKTIGGAGAVAVLVIGAILPTGYNLMAGYQLEKLKKEQAVLEARRAELQAEESRLLSASRLAQLARQRKFEVPAPRQVVHLEDGAKVARNAAGSIAR